MTTETPTFNSLKEMIDTLEIQYPICIGDGILTKDGQAIYRYFTPIHEEDAGLPQNAEPIAILINKVKYPPQFVYYILKNEVKKNDNGSTDKKARRGNSSIS